MSDPQKILDRLLAAAAKKPNKPAVNDKATLERIEYVCRCMTNRAGVRLLMACMLAKLDKPEVDPRKPYTEIGSEDCFSGRTYDERYINHFININRLPCNSTTAFLTPALRNIDKPLTTDIAIIGRPAQLYSDTLKILEDVALSRVSAEKVLTDAIRILINVRSEKESRMETLLAGLQRGKDALPMSSEAIVNLLMQHLACKHSSRLPVLIVSAAYHVAAEKIGEKASSLMAHNAADEQTGAMGDIEILLTNDERIATIYEMKTKRVVIDDIDRALQKIVMRHPRIDNYIFITTDIISDDVREYASCVYERTSGTEIAILDCIGFARHFLHFFHRLRTEFLDEYQRLVLAEPDSAVNQPLKEAFLSLRQAAESDE